MNEEEEMFSLPYRTEDGNKGTFGTVTIVGGCENYLGAPLLSGRAAYRIGCGLVEMIVPKVVRNCGAGIFPEAIWNCAAYEEGRVPKHQQKTAAVIGPGLGKEPETAERLPGYIRGASENRSMTLLDADALNLLASDPEWYQSIPDDCVLTPHPGEMSRLCGTSIPAIQYDRRDTAFYCAQQWHQVVLLKGAHTVIASPDGRIRILTYCTSALATAGSGDVLSGVIAGLGAQGMKPYEASCLGADIHARAGLLAAAHFGNNYAVTASDIINFIPAAINEVLAIQERRHKGSGRR